MSERRKRWEEAIGFDWRKEEPQTKDEASSEAVALASEPVPLQGIGIVDDNDAAAEEDVFSMIQNLNEEVKPVAKAKPGSITEGIATALEKEQQDAFNRERHAREVAEAEKREFEEAKLLQEKAQKKGPANLIRETVPALKEKAKATASEKKKRDGAVPKPHQKDGAHGEASSPHVVPQELLDFEMERAAARSSGAAEEQKVLKRMGAKDGGARSSSEEQEPEPEVYVCKPSKKCSAGPEEDLPYEFGQPERAEKSDREIECEKPYGEAPLQVPEEGPLERGGALAEEAESKRAAEPSEPLPLSEETAKAARGGLVFAIKKRAREKKLREELPAPEFDWEYIGTHDKMTGLLNQNAFEIAKAEPVRGTLAIATVDVNNLKLANDSYGHEAGNKLIRAVSEELSAALPEGACYRTGGDEFVVVMKFKNKKQAEERLVEARENFEKALSKRNDSNDGLVYSASFGYAVGDEKSTFESVVKEADESMYKNKTAYKKSHPELDARSKSEKKKDAKAPEREAVRGDAEDYDEHLSEEQRALKGKIRANHMAVSQKSTKEIVMEIERRASEVVAVLIASPTYDQLFIILSADAFVSVANEMDSLMDYSYLYIVYRSESVYKGADEYLEDVSDFFVLLGNRLREGKIKSEKDILKTKGINVFKNVWIS